jgi:hypothetical protein
MLTSFLLVGTLLLVPAPVTPEELAGRSTDVVQGLVAATTFVGVEERGDYRIAKFRSDLKIARVEKGTHKPGETIPIIWVIESWVGKGPQPPGRWPSPIINVCDEVVVYLFGTPDKGYSFADGNGAVRTLKQAPATSLDDKKRTARCVKGKAE